jgi:hypothetical protein
MSQMRDSIVFYRSFYEAIKEIPLEEQGVVYNAIYGYALDGIEPELTGIAKAIFLLVKPQIDANNTRYENGKKGGKSKVNQNVTETEPNSNQNVTEVEPKPNQDETETEPNVNVNENVNVNDLKENTKRKVFTKPTVEEVKAYCAERKNDVNPDKFIDFYESKGWLIGKNPMKDWKACVRTWEKGGSSPPKIVQQKPSSVYVNPTQKEFDDLSGFYAN